MRQIYEFAEFMVSGWKLAQPAKSIPINDGTLDLAFERILVDLPPSFASTLNFGNTRSGFRCYDLPDILHAAYNNLLISPPTPAHRKVDVLINEDTARVLLRRRNISIPEASAFAEKLSKLCDSLS